MIALNLLWQCTCSSTKCRGGRDFRKHLYISEYDKETSEYFHEREDHNHPLKRLTNFFRAGEIPDINLKFSVDALHDHASGLTKTALTGVNEQSIPVCERVFSVGVMKYIKDQGHQTEYKFVKLMNEWHEASDGCGLTEETRHKANLNMLHLAT